MDVQQPPQRDTLAPTASLLAAGFAGTPLAVVTVSVLNRTVFDVHPLSVEEAVAFGGVGAAVFGYLFHIAKTLVDRAIERVGRDTTPGE
jgi:hypothetical protein